MEQVQENIENKYEKFLKLVKTNPEVIESQVAKNQYKYLLNIVMEKAKVDHDRIGALQKLLQQKILDKNDKKQYMELLQQAINE